MHDADALQAQIALLAQRGRAWFALRWSQAQSAVVAPFVFSPTDPLPIAQYSLPPYLRWFYFTLLRSLLRLAPLPMWRVPAVVLAVVAMFANRDARRLNVALLRATGVMPTPSRQWRLHWSRAYQRQCERLLVVQADRLTPAWAARHVRLDGELPPGGAILIAPHHSPRVVPLLALATHVTPIGSITIEPRDAEEFARQDPTVQWLWRLTRPLRTQIDGYHQFTQRAVARRGLEFLNAGGYLIVLADNFTLEAERYPLLGAEVTVPRGAAWLSQKTGKPIIPYVMVPDGFGWRLWLREPVEPTRSAITAAIGECIRQVPGSWEQSIGMVWLRVIEAQSALS